MSPAVLFVGAGNICRSPAAHAVLQHTLERRGAAGRVAVGSAGIGDWHAGEPPEQRSRGLLEVPDPYYGGAEGFEQVLDLVEDAADGLLERLGLPA